MFARADVCRSRREISGRRSFECSLFVYVLVVSSGGVPAEGCVSSGVVSAAAGRL
jgi:hypothetical protein